MNKKVLFLRASSGWKDPSPPLAFSYLGKIAKDAGFEVRVVNLNAQYNKTTLCDVINFIKKEKPIVGISIFTNYAQNSYELIRKIRPYSEVIIAGGPHVTIFPEETLKKGADIAVLGEAEASFANLLKAVYTGKSLSKINGIVYKDKKNGEIKKTKPAKSLNLDDLPISDKDVHRKSDYIKTKGEINNFGGILSSRGCPGQCTYCYHSLFGRCFRYRSAKNVFNEIIFLHKKYGVNHINFIDDAFTIKKDRLNELCDMLINAHLPIEWVCATRIDFLDKDVIFKMKKAGCVMISLGIENCIPSTLIKIKKTTNPEWYLNQAKNVLKWCYEARIRVGVNILTGFPWDTAEDIRKIQRYVKKISPYVTQSFCGGVLQPLPNTEVYDEYAKKYEFENWWLNKKPLFKEDYHPFFMSFYQPFWEQLHNNFFKLRKDVFDKINRLYKIMGKWNLWIITKRRFKNPIMRFAVYSGLVWLSKLSLLLFNISPRLEKTLMNPIIVFSYGFKYKN